jgi:acetolactate synthase-1/2/3 large subunit
VAEAYGLRTEIIEDQNDLREAVRRVLSIPGPVVCDVRLLPEEARQPRLSAFQRPDGSLVSKPLEDLWPYLEREEFQANMLIPMVEE